MADSNYFKGGTGSHSKVDRGASKDGAQDYSLVGRRHAGGTAASPPKNRTQSGSWNSGAPTTSAPKGPMHPK